MINLIENIRQALDERYIGCGIFVDLQKAFDTVDHEILLSKLDYYGIWGISNNWFKSYLSNCKQFVSINGYDSELAEIKCGVPQGFFLGPLLILLYINDLNQATKFCKVNQFADDTTLLHLGKYDLKICYIGSMQKKNSLNVKKTELVIFKFKRKQFDGEIKLKLSRKGLFQTDSVKCLEVKIDWNLSWKSHIGYLSVKVSKAFC